MTRHAGFGSTLKVDYAGGTAYVAVAQVRDISGPSISRESIEVPPDHDISDNFKEFFPGSTDPGEVTFALNLDPGTAAHVGAVGTGLLGSFEDTEQCDLHAWEFECPGMCGGTATWTFDGFVTGMDFDMGAVEGPMSADLTIKISGKPTLVVT